MRAAQVASSSAAALSPSPSKAPSTAPASAFSTQMRMNFLDRSSRRPRACRVAAGVAFGDDPSLELGAGTSVSFRHRLASLGKPAPGLFRSANLSSPRGAFHGRVNIGCRLTALGYPIGASNGRPLICRAAASVPKPANHAGVMGAFRYLSLATRRPAFSVAGNSEFRSACPTHCAVGQHSRTSSKRGATTWADFAAVFEGRWTIRSMTG